MMSPWIWVVYGGVALVSSLLVGTYLGRFREAYTEMTGMMAGMTMGMLNGFLFGYAAAAATGSSMFYGNLFGILMGTAVGVYYGRAGGLMGMLDGGMGGAMGGSMGAMLEVMLFAPEYVYWTAALMVGLYILGMAGLVVLIERSSDVPEHAAMHRTFPWLTRAIATEVAEELERQEGAQVAGSKARLSDYYVLFGVPRNAAAEDINNAYLDKLASASAKEAPDIERAFSILSDPNKRQAYDRSRAALNGDDGRGDCCPPARKKVRTAETTVLAASAPAMSAAAPAVVARTARAEQTVAQAASTRQPAPKAAPVAKQPGGRPNQQQAARPKAHAQAPSRGQQKRAQARRESPVSWVGVGALFVVAVFLSAWWLMGANGQQAQAGQQTAWEPRHASAPNPDAARLEAEAVAAVPGPDGVQTLDFTVNGNTWGYEPNIIKVKQGQPVRLNIGTTGRDPGCGRYVVFRGLGAHGIAEPGKVIPTEFTPGQAGVFEINCGMNMMNPGYLVVTQ